MPDLGDGVDHMAVDGLGDQGAWGIQGDTQISGISIPEKGPPKGRGEEGVWGETEESRLDIICLFSPRLFRTLHLLCGETSPCGWSQRGQLPTPSLCVCVSPGLSKGPCPIGWVSHCKGNQGIPWVIEIFSITIEVEIALVYL